MRPRVLISLACTVGLVPIFVECRDATQMIVDVTTDIPCAQLESTNIQVGDVGALASRNPATATTGCKGTVVGTLVITPSGDNDGEVAFRVAAGIGVDPSTCTDAQTASTCIIARRQLRFIPHETIRIEVPLKQACAGLTCDPTTTCFSGGCTSATIDSSKCANGVCPESALGAVPATSTGAISNIVWGEDYGCLLRNGQVYCFGTNALGQLANGQSGGASATPMLAQNLTDVIAISAGESTAGALKKDGSVWLWGSPGDGLILGADPNASAISTPLRIQGVSSFSQFCVGHGYACGVNGTTLQCWGGILVEDTKVAPETMSLTGPVASIACGDQVTVLRMADGTMQSFGSGDKQVSPALGRGDHPDSGLFPIPVPDLSGITNSVSGVQDTIAWGPSGVFHWGTDRGGIANSGSAADSSPTILAGALASYSSYAVGNLHACGLRGTQVDCWGVNEYGQLGQPLSTPSSAARPLPVTLPLPATAVWAGNHDACAQTSDGKLYCWGANDFGQIGNGSADTSAPHPAPTLMLLP